MHHYTAVQWKFVQTAKILRADLGQALDTAPEFDTLREPSQAQPNGEIIRDDTATFLWRPPLLTRDFYLR
jgi:hypothetical protein